MIQKTLIDTEEAAHAILEYITSEDFDKVEQSIEDNGRAGLMTGLALSINLIIAKCTKYIYTVQDAPMPKPVSDTYKLDDTDEERTKDAVPSKTPVG